MQCSESLFENIERICLRRIQIINGKYKRDASNNSMVYSTIYAPRGIIYDRNGRALVTNKVSYDIMVTPREVKAFDTLALATVLDTTADYVRERMAYYREYRSRIFYPTRELFDPIHLLSDGLYKFRPRLLVNKRSQFLSSCHVSR